MQTTRPVVPLARCPPQRAPGPETPLPRQEQALRHLNTLSRAMRLPTDRYEPVQGEGLLPARFEVLVECWTQQDRER